MSRLVVASQLQPAFNAAIAARLTDVEIVPAPPGPPASLPDGAAILIAAPFRKAGGPLTASPPQGWPFDLRWIQLVSVGTDFYPEGLPISGHAPQNAGSQRLLAAAAQGARLDKRLWTGVAAVTGAAGNSTALVGTPDQVADALLDYRDLGVSTFLIRGFDPYEDSVQYGAELIRRSAPRSGSASRSRRNRATPSA